MTFVTPWPEGKNYVSKSGNSLTKEFEEHFNGFCYKCGLSNHTAMNCRIYTDKTVILTLCTECRRGLHDTCKNYKKFKDSTVATGNQVTKHLSADTVSHITMQLRSDLEELVKKLVVTHTPPPYWYPPPQANPAITDGADGDDNN